MKNLLSITILLICFVFCGCSSKMSEKPPENKIETDEPEKMAMAMVGASDLSGLYLKSYEDIITEKIFSAIIVFKTPEAMAKGEKRNVQLLLSMSEGEENLVVKIKPSSSEVVETDKILACDMMSANLTGSGFKIVEVTPSEQIVFPEGITEWRWEIESLAKGKQNLYLSINVSLNTGKEKAPKSVRTFEREIVVKYPLWNSIKDFVAENWQWLWTASLPFILWIYTKRRKIKSSLKKCFSDSPLKNKNR